MNQASIFEGTEPLKIKKPVRLIELFAGYGSQALALKYLGVPFEHWRICEWAYKSIIAYKDCHMPDDCTDYSADKTKEEVAVQLAKIGVSANYNEPMSLAQVRRMPEPKLRQIYNAITATHNLVNISQTKGTDLCIENTDKYTYIMSYSYPCVPAGTLVATANGYKPIEKVSVGDQVLTHCNRFQTVQKTMSRVSDHYYSVKGLGVPRLCLTGEHPLLVWRNNAAQWIPAKELKKSDYLAFNVNDSNVPCGLTDQELWLLGRYVADGFINKYLYNSVEYAIGVAKAKEFDSHTLGLPFRKCASHKTCWQYRIANKRFQALCREFGNGASNKHIPQWVIDLPCKQLQPFFDGYISGDGHIRRRGKNTQIMFTTVSEQLFLGMQQIIAKLYRKICSCSIRHDNRKSTFLDSYNAQFSLMSNRPGQFCSGNKIYTAIKQIERVPNYLKVYNLEVAQDNSYTCSNVIVHNCQDLSNVGQRQGMSRDSGTRSGLLWEVERILNECSDNLPQVLLMENVPQVHSSKNIADFREWIAFLDSKGYTNVWKDMNAKDYGIPQNRNRCFMVSFLGDYFYDFPTKQKLNLRLGDVLEQNVDESYYLSNSTVEYFMANTEKQKANGNGFAFKPFDYSQDRNAERENSSLGADAKRSETRRQLHSDPLNAEPDGSCRTIKAQYAKNSTANFVRQGTFGATGVMTCEVARTVQATASKHQASDNYIKEKQK